MLIDWFTVGAQVLNFLILVWLLKHFLYQPILNAIDAREKRIAAELADADAKKAEAQKERDDFQNKNKAFDEQRSALIAFLQLPQRVQRGRARLRFDDAIIAPVLLAQVALDRVQHGGFIVYCENNRLCQLP